MRGVWHARARRQACLSAERSHPRLDATGVDSVLNFREMASTDVDLEDAFRRHPDRILKVTDALVKERFFRSSALLKAQVSDEKAVVASMKLLSDRAKFDAILAPPTKSAASAPNAVAAAGLGNAARDASSS